MSPFVSLFVLAAPTNTMEILLDLLRHVEVNDESYSFNVNAATSNICRHQYVIRPFLETERDTKETPPDRHTGRHELI